MSASATTPRRRAGVLRVPVLGMPIHRRAIITTSALTVAAALLGIVSLGLGDFPLTPAQVVQALLGRAGDAGDFAITIVREWRLPRTLAALAFGAALALSGAVFQSLTRNPLGSPDIIGFSTGSYTGALIALTVVGSAYLSTAVGALLGGLGTALIVYLLAYRGGLQGFRLIVVGIAVTAVLHAVNLYLLLRAQTQVSMAASIWGAGSLSLVGWAQLSPALIALALTVPGLVLAPALRQLELGDDAARAHGLRLEPARLGLVLYAVALVAIVTASTGPIAFVALAAPQIARRLVGGAGIPLAAAAATGAFVLLGADLIAQHGLAHDVPVGMVTVVLGGVYLLGLLVREARAA